MATEVNGNAVEREVGGRNQLRCLRLPWSTKKNGYGFKRMWIYASIVGNSLKLVGGRSMLAPQRTG